MKASAVGTIVAERRLELDARGKVIVRVGRPRKYRGSTSYCCPCEITGLSGRHSSRVGGADAFQAMELVVQP